MQPKVKDNVLILEDVILQEALLFKETSEFKTIPYILYKTPIGYYAGWDCIKGKSIYCGSRNECPSLKQIKEYAKTSRKNM